MKNIVDYIDSDSFDLLLFQIEKLLTEYPQGLIEYDLMQKLKSLEAFSPFASINKTSLDLYIQHFILFHALYRLQDKLISSKNCDIVISALEIKLIPLYQNDKQLHKLDKLRGYYLDVSNLVNSSEESVNELLHSFWEKYLRNDHRNEALNILGLTDPVDNATITAEYRKQAMEHHPDRGGEPEKFKSINEAYSLLIG